MPLGKKCTLIYIIKIVDTFTKALNQSNLCYIQDIVFFEKNGTLRRIDYEINSR